MTEESKRRSTKTTAIRSRSRTAGRSATDSDAAEVVARIRWVRLRVARWLNHRPGLAKRSTPGDGVRRDCREIPVRGRGHELWVLRQAVALVGGGPGAGWSRFGTQRGVLASMRASKDKGHDRTSLNQGLMLLGVGATPTLTTEVRVIGNPNYLRLVNTTVLGCCAQQGAPRRNRGCRLGRQCNGARS